MNARSFYAVAVLAVVGAAGLAFVPYPNDPPAGQPAITADSCGGYAYFRPAPDHPYVINEVLEMEGMWAVVKEGDSSYTFHPRPEYTDGQRQEVLSRVQMLLNHIADVNGYERVQVQSGKSYGNGIIPIAPRPSSPEVAGEPVVSRFCPARHLPKHRIT